MRRSRVTGYGIGYCRPPKTRPNDLSQFFVQGARGVVPAPLTEMSPDSIRSSLPGMAYQIGVLLASVVPYLEAAFTHNGRYSDAMAATAAIAFVLAAAMIMVGRENEANPLGRRCENGSVREYRSARKCGDRSTRHSAYCARITPHLSGSQQNRPVNGDWK
jgi:hypothetical protein